MFLFLLLVTKQLGLPGDLSVSSLFPDSPPVLTLIALAFLAKLIHRK
jgi:hypothetical protein